MNCYFCSEELFSIHYNKSYLCKNHKYDVYFVIEINNTSEAEYYFEFRYDNKWYIVDYKNSDKSKCCKIFYQNELIAEFNCIPDLSPENIDEKFPMLLTFS